MRPAIENNMENIVLETTNRLSSLSIIVDDFDSSRKNNKQKKSKQSDEEDIVRPSGMKPYTRQSSDAAIKKIMEEAELRKHEFCKLLDEHDALVEYLKRIENEHSNAIICKQAPIMT